MNNSRIRHANLMASAAGPRPSNGLGQSYAPNADRARMQVLLIESTFENFHQIDFVSLFLHE